jgi:hypothetical protein
MVNVPDFKFTEAFHFRGGTGDPCHPLLVVCLLNPVGRVCALDPTISQYPIGIDCGYCFHDFVIAWAPWFSCDYWDKCPDSTYVELGDNALSFNGGEVTAPIAGERSFCGVSRQRVACANWPLLRLPSLSLSWRFSWRATLWLLTRKMNCALFLSDGNRIKRILE